LVFASVALFLVPLSSAISQESETYKSYLKQLDGFLQSSDALTKELNVTKIKEDYCIEVPPSLADDKRTLGDLRTEYEGLRDRYKAFKQDVQAAVAKTPSELNGFPKSPAEPSFWSASDDKIIVAPKNALIAKETALATAENCGLKPPELSKVPSQSSSSGEFDPEDPLKGLSKPELNWPDPPAPLPTDVVAFCMQQEEINYRTFVLGPIWKQVQDLYDLARHYSEEVDLRLWTVNNKLRDFENREVAQPGSTDPEEVAKWRKAKVALEPVDAEAMEFRDIAREKRDEFSKYDDQVHDAKIVACLCDEVGMPKGLGVAQIDSRGKPHLPGRDYIYKHNKPGDAGYLQLRITAKPEIAKCLTGGEGETRISFPLSGGASTTPDYFDWEIKDGTLPNMWFPDTDFSKMTVTFDNGVAVDATSFVWGVAVPSGAKTVKRIEIYMRDGGWDDNGKLTTTKLEWTGQ
jgi:hypothetical protein